MDHRETEARLCEKVVRHLSTDSEDLEFKETYKRADFLICLWKQFCHVSSRMTSARQPAVNPTIADQSMHPSWKLKIYEKAFGENSAQSS